jgi:hypothetical protein
MKIILALIFMTTLWGCSTDSSKEKLNRHYTRSTHATSDDIYLKENNKFDRSESRYIFTEKYSGTYEIDNNRISFNYSGSDRPHAELTKGLITDSTITIYYVMEYSRDDYMKDGKLLNGVDSTIFGTKDTIAQTYKIVAKKGNR